MRLHKTLIFLFSLLIGVAAQGQDSAMFTFQDFMLRVENHHPVAVQAQWINEGGQAAFLESKGNFDPEAFTKVAQKYFSDDQYYSLIDGGLRVPTWFGLSAEAGFEQNQGIYLDPSKTVPSNGLYYAGVNLTLGQGLFIDKRRAEYKKAAIYMDIAALEQSLMLNNLLLEAGQAYWAWYEAFYDVKIFREGYELATQRFSAVKLSASLGDRPAVDTLEAGIQVQNRLLSLQEAELEFQNMSVKLGLYLWQDGYIPIELAETTQPEPFYGDVRDLSSLDLNTPIDSLLANHPALRQLDAKMNSLDIERRMKAEALKPKIDLSYRALVQNPATEMPQPYDISDYTWGLSFTMPLFLRSERGALRKVKLDIATLESKTQFTQAKVTAEVQMALNQMETTRSQAEVYQNNARDYGALLAAERKLFNAGESSLFLVNSREIGFIQSRIKWVEAVAKNKKSQVYTYYSLGVLPRNL
ncbi:MAG: TolC family protein [Schleiferiaceae bacterium]